MAYGVIDLRGFARQFVRQAADSSMYSDTQIDRALQLAGDEWMRITHAKKTTGTQTLTAGSNVLPTIPTGWAPEYAIQQYLTLAGEIVAPNIEFVDYIEVLQQRKRLGNPSGQPQFIGYADLDTTGECTPTPNAAFVLHWWYWQPFTNWTPGGICTSFNLPDEHLRIIATDGAEAFLQTNEKDNAGVAAAALERFQRKARAIRGRMAGGRGGSVMLRDDPDACGNVVFTA